MGKRSEMRRQWRDGIEQALAEYRAGARFIAKRQWRRDLPAAETQVFNAVHEELLFYGHDLSRRECMASWAILVIWQCMAVEPATTLEELVQLNLDELVLLIEQPVQGNEPPPELAWLHALARARLEQMGLIAHPEVDGYFKKEFDRLTLGLGKRLTRVGELTEVDRRGRGRPLDLKAVIKRLLARRLWLHWALSGFPDKLDVVACEGGKWLGFHRQQMLALMPTIVKTGRLGRSTRPRRA